jgi:invasion protein IalB
MPFRRSPTVLAILSASLALSAPALAQDKDQKPQAAPAATPPSAAPAAAPAKASPQETGALPARNEAPGWAVQCANPGKGLSCRASQTIVVAKSRKLLAQVSVSKPEAGKDAAMMLHLPLGLYNPAGVTLTVDDQKPEVLPIQTCDAKGCYAGTAVTADRLSSMSKGTKLNIAVQDLNKKQITIPVPLKGFEDAFKKL